MVTITKKKEELVKKEINEKEEYRQIQLQALFKKGLPPDVYEHCYQEIIDQ